MPGAADSSDTVDTTFWSMLHKLNAHETLSSSTGPCVSTASSRRPGFIVNVPAGSELANTWKHVNIIFGVE